MLNSLFSLGIDEDLLFSDVKHVKLLNALSIFSFFLIIAFIPIEVHYYPQTKWILLFNCLMPFAYTSVLIFNWTKHYTLARLTFNLPALFFICLASFQVGPEANGHSNIILVIVTAFFIYPKHERVYQYLVISIALSAFILIEILFYLNVSPAYFPKIPTSILSVSFNFALVLFLIGFAYYISENYKLAEENLETEKQKSESLLHNILPEKIADRLKSNPETIADGFEESSILFADIVNFTPLAENNTPNNVVAMLNEIFSKFDDLVEKHGLEKIKTVGDAYMVASGIPEKNNSHAEAIAEMSLDMNESIHQVKGLLGKSLQLRIGINSGPVVAGVIGKKKFIYDLWGDSVNTAARMESHGVPGKIQVTSNTYSLLKSKYKFKERGEIDIKGKGLMRTYFLEGRQSSSVV